MKVRCPFVLERESDQGKKLPKKRLFGKLYYGYSDGTWKRSKPVFIDACFQVNRREVLAVCSVARVIHVVTAVLVCL